MRLNSFSDFSLRVLIYLGVSSEDLATAQQISQAYGISQNHLVKVIHNLARLGIIESFKGRGGGIRLALEPSDINIGELIRKLESESPLVECFTESSQCKLTPSCKLKNLLAEANEAFYNSLEEYSLDNILTPRSSLRKSLGLTT